MTALELVLQAKAPFLPGVFTPSEVMQARAVQAALLGLSTPEDR